MFSEPAIGEKFFGREDVLELLNKRVLALKDGYRQNVALTGQSLSGKSSIILHFLRTIEDDGFVPVYVEVIKENFRSFSNKFIATMLYNSLRKMGEAVDIEIEALIDKARALLPKTYLAIKNVNSYIERGDLDEAYSALLGLTSILKTETKFSCIVILDEFDNLEKIGVRNQFTSFGKVIMVQKDTMYIVASSRGAAIKKILSEKLALLFGNFEVVKISNFDRKTSCRFLDIKLAGFDIEEGMVKFLTAFTDGNPFYLDKMASHIKGLALERMSSHIDADIIARAMVDLVYNFDGAIHQYLTNFILELLDTRQKDIHLGILGAIANGKNRHPAIAKALKMKQGEVLKGAALLIEAGLISKNGAFYKIDDTMLGFWLRHVYQRRKEMLVDGVLDKNSLFIKEAHSYIDGFMSELVKSAVARVAELFNRFSNELVQVESKHIRLPHFTKVEVKSFADSSAFVCASFRGNSWIIQPYRRCVTENDIINYIRNAKTLDTRQSSKIIIPLADIEENARLLAKELKISLWNDTALNMLFEFYGMKKMVTG